MPGNDVDGLQAKPVCFVVRRHVFKTIAIDAPAVEALINIVHNGNPVSFIAIVLWQQAVAYGLHQPRLFSRKETDGGYLLNTGQHDVARSFIPEGLLAQRGKAWIIAWLGSRQDWLVCIGIYRQAACVYLLGQGILFDVFSSVFVSYFHQSALLRRLASRPRKPVAAYRSGAKIGGPYNRL